MIKNLRGRTTALPIRPGLNAPVSRQSDLLVQERVALSPPRRSIRALLQIEQPAATMTGQSEGLWPWRWISTLANR